LGKRKENNLGTPIYPSGKFKVRYQDTFDNEKFTVVNADNSVAAMKMVMNQKDCAIITGIQQYDY
jgi:hypothetical protein